jgi:NAD(P)H-hydrate repair Nnr-like enzyme with NAD(P)H-hydrate dehydratase domain
VHGLAGDIAADYYSQRGMIARDIVQCLPEAWHELESEQD